MKLLEQIETTTTGWLKFLPKMPSDVQKSMSEYVWVAAAAGAVFSLIGAISVVDMLQGASSLVFNTFGVELIDRTMNAALWISIFELAVVFVLLVMSTSSLKRHERSGWDKLFLVAVLGAVSSVLQFVFTFEVSNLVSGVLWFLIEVYFLIQVKNYFIRSKARKA